jgi:hypothetical protein
MPGLVELHTDNLERHIEPRPKVDWPHASAIIAHDAELASVGITTVFDALGVGDTDPESVRGGNWKTVLETLDLCTRENLLRADHHLHVRCELPAANTIDLFEPFHAHPRLSLISLMDHTPGQRQWENIEVARVYYIGKKGWSDEKFDRQVIRAAELQERYAQPQRACRAFVFCHGTHEIQRALFGFPAVGVNAFIVGPGVLVEMVVDRDVHRRLGGLASGRRAQLAGTFRPEIRKALAADVDAPVRGLGLNMHNPAGVGKSLP